MTTTTYISAMVKILQKPKKRLIKNKILVVTCLVQSPQFRNKIAVKLVFWGKLGEDIYNYYQVNDYILVEGYLSLPIRKNLKKIEIITLKAYPFILNKNHKIK